MRERIIERLTGRSAGEPRLSPRAALASPEASPRRAAREALTPAGVLVPLIERAEGLTLLLTERSAHLPDHPGQVSFPGGRQEPGDRDLVETALRETEEEIGLARARVSVLGCLDPYRTGTGFVVTPVVGLVAPPVELVLDSYEVAEVFEVPLAFLLDPANRRRERRRYPEGVYDYHLYEFGGRRIWGATAAMIVNFVELVGREGP